MYKCFLLLHVAIFILNNVQLMQNYADFAQAYLETFVAYSAQVFGNIFVSFNVHNLLHLVAEARSHGVLSSFSAYSFENELRHLKKFVKASPRPLQQICKRILERNRFNSARKTRPSRHFIITHDNGPIGGVNGVVRQFKKYEDGNYCLSVGQPDNCVGLANGQIGLINNFVECVEEERSVHYVVCQVFTEYNNLYDYPLESSSSLLNIHVVSGLSREYSVFNFEEIKHKCVLLPHFHVHVCFPLLHQLN